MKDSEDPTIAKTFNIDVDVKEKPVVVVQGTDDSDDNSSDIGWIILIIVLVIMVIVGVNLIIYFCCCKKKNIEGAAGADSEVEVQNRVVDDSQMDVGGNVSALGLVAGKPANS